MMQKHYFEHPFTFSAFPEMLFLMSDGGAYTFGRCCLLIEYLGCNENQLDVSNEVNRFALCQKLELDETGLEKFLERAAKSGLFFKTGNILSSKMVGRAFDKMTAKSQKARDSVNKRWNKDTNAYEPIRSDTNVSERISTDTNAYEGIRPHTNRLDKKREEEKRREEIRPDETTVKKEEPGKSKDTTNNNMSPDGSGPPQAPDKISSAEVHQIMAFYNSITVDLLPEAKIMNEKRGKLVKKLIKTHGNKKIIEVFNKAAESDFLCGRSEKPFNNCDFDWIINEANFIKILEGKYDNGKYKKPLPPAIASLKKANEEARANGGNAEGAIW